MQPGDGTWHADGNVAVMVPVAVVLPVDQEHFRRRTGRCCLTKIIRNRLPGGGPINDKSTTTDVSGRGISHR